MTLEQSDTIDFVAHDPDRDEVMLVMVEERPWSDRGLLLPDLEAKLNTYLAYATGGRLVADYPEMAGRPVHIQLRAAHAPGDRELELLRIVAKQHLQPVGIQLSWRRIGDDDEHAI